MAKPRVFISSTFYDLKHIRAELDYFINNLGYEPIRNEEGDIPYGSKDRLEEYCYKEIENSDILISIIGGRYGTKSERSENSSISQTEFEVALKLKKQVYIFIEKNVLAEYETFLINKENAHNINFKHVDKIEIYKFIENIKGLNSNNNIKGFETSSDITQYLKSQLAGLFQRFLSQKTRDEEISLINKLENTAGTLNKLVNYLSDANNDKEEEINRILTINHPLVETLKEKLEIKYNFYIEGFDDLNHLLNATGFKNENLYYDKWSIEVEYYYWYKKTKKLNASIKIANEVFDSEARLKYYRKKDWNDSYVVYSDIDPSVEEDISELPF